MRAIGCVRVSTQGQVDGEGLGVTHGAIEKSGNHMSFGGVALGNGRERSREALAENPELQNMLRQAIVASGPAKPGARANAEA